MQKTSQETKDLIISLYKENKYTKTAIAKRVGCSIDTVNRILEKAGLKPIVLSQKLQNIAECVKQDFLDGMYCKDLANKYKVEEHSIYKILDFYHIKRQTGIHSNCNENYFEQIDTPDKAYILGFITADGAVVNDVLSVEVKDTDIEVLNFMCAQINPQATLTPTRSCHKVTFGAKKLGRDLFKYGIIQNKSKTIQRVPVELIPENLLCFYFRGLIDGDGCILKDGKLNIYSGSQNFIQDVQNILINRLHLSHNNIYKGTTYFISWSSKKDKEKLFHYLYDDLDATFYYDRKYQRLLKNCNQANTEITN